MKNQITTSIRTYREYPDEKLTLADMKEVIEKVRPLPIKTMYICKKHWKALKKELSIRDISNTASPFLSPLLAGITVIIKPYLKKIRIYTEE